MQFGVVSDTHDNVAAVEEAVVAFERRGIDTIVHCGDVIAPPVVPFFDGFEVHAVLGNNDGELDGLEAAFRELGNGSALHGRRADLEIGSARVGVIHGEDREEVERLARGGGFDYVCYGHHHEAEVREVADATVVNPGAHFPTVASEHRSVAVIDVEADEVELVGIDV